MKNKGNEVKIIDYRPKELINAYHMDLFYIKHIILELKKEKTNKFFLLKFINRVIRYYMWYILNWKLVIKMYKFNKFIQKVFIKSAVSYNNVQKLVSNPPAYDCYIAGSDQIWNVDNTGGILDKAFFLQFGSNKTIRMIYGASCGQKNPSQICLQNILHYCDGLNYISVREKSLKDSMIKINNHLLVQKVCDPVFLLGKDEWENIRKPIKTKHNYILLYLLDLPKGLQGLVDKLHCYYKGYKIYDLSPRKTEIRGIDKWYQSCGPSQFLGFVNNAKLILTNSFHGTAFSIIYRKTFIALIRPDTGIRVSELLVNLRLEDRIYDKEKEIDSYDKLINYSYAEEYIYSERKKSMNFLDSIK